MNFLKKLFSSKSEIRKEEIKKQDVDLSLDDAFVHNFIQKGGKFLYCTKMDEVVVNLTNIIKENNWDTIICSDFDLLKLTKKVKIKTKDSFDNENPFFTGCEHLIANDGSIMFTSNQLGSSRFNSFSENFIVYATTSQMVSDTNEGLTSIKTRFSGNIPTNISAIKNFDHKNIETDSLDFSSTNTKNLYLILFEDL